METNELIPFVEPIPEESVLVRRASSGEVDAFIQLFEAYGDDLYRYVYFRVLSDVAAEAITSQVFRHAWDNVGHGPKKGATFVEWIYELARNQVIVYYTANLRSREFNLNSLLSAADYRLEQEVPDWSQRESWGNHLRLLTGDIEQSRLQSTAALIMRKYLEYLNPGSRARQSPTFNSYSRAWLIRYMHFHPRGRGYAMITPARQARPRLDPAMIPRVALVTAMLAAAMLVTGTAEAQSALPGDPLYGWKRTSEQAMLSISPDPLGTEIFIANRRLEELILVKHDPLRSVSALDGYYEALSQLSTSGNPQTRERIVPLLEDHRKKIAQSGIASPQLEQYISAVVTAIPQTDDLGLAATIVPPTIAPTDVLLPTGVPATTTVESTVAAPPVIILPTDTPTAVPPTPTATLEPTDTPTPVPPTPTATEILPTPTDIPTDVPTDVPTDTPDAPPTDSVPPTYTSP